MSSGSYKQHGLVTDFRPHIRLMQIFGFAIFDYHDNNNPVMVILRKLYSYGTLILISTHFFLVIMNFIKENQAGGDLAADTITMLFFAHPVVKLLYFAMRTPRFYSAFSSWNSINSHPLFVESHNRHRAAAVSHARKLLMGVVAITMFTIICWVTSTFFGESTKQAKDPENKNETITVEIPRLPIHAWYPWDAMTGTPYMFSFLYQLYWLTMTLFQANLFDLLFCCFVVVACEQLEHIKDALKPLLDLSTNAAPGTVDLFRVDGDQNNQIEEPIMSKDEQQINIRGIYSNIRDFGVNGSNGVSAISGPNGLNKKQDIMVRSAIKYWVERHKHIVRYVDTVGDAFGLSLLYHMLISTVSLTLLAYQATQVNGMSLFSMSVIGYLVYVLAQVFAFCLYGNNLIEVSSSVMESAYSAQWYEGSDEAKTFIQIVCQQCQKSVSISGAKFFTVSLDLFASVLGAMVTYFMVLVQLK